MTLVPCPPDALYAGPLAEVARKLVGHVGAEQRRSWTAPSGTLRVSETGRLGALHYPDAAFEEAGLRGLLVYFNDCFPRATPVLSKLSPPTFAAVWRELFVPPEDGTVRVYERTGPMGRAVYGVAPPSYPSDYDVSHLVADVADIFGTRKPVPCLLRYDAGACAVELRLGFGDYHVVVAATDVYDAGGVTVGVVTTTGTNLGDPLPDVKRRRRGGGEGRTVVEGVAAKIRAAQKHYNNWKQT